MVIHALSFDVEEWYDGNLHRDWVLEAAREMPGRLASEWERILNLLSRQEVRATFFILGRAAQRLPELVRATAAEGHEIASHGFDHQLVHRQPPADFASDVERTRKLLQDLSGQPVWGFRAPSWSLRRSHEAYLLGVSRAGHLYSSSIFPMRTPLYGDSTAPITPYRHELPGLSSLLEIPPAVSRWGPLRLPYGGGVYWRLWPASATTALLRRASKPQVTYLHPWELNPVPAPMPPGLPWLARFVLTHGLAGSFRRLQDLLSAIPFTRIDRVYSDQIRPRWDADCWR